MGLKTFVKINSVTNLSDARYCAGMGVDILGFNIDPEAESYMPPDKYQAITEWISGTQFAAELPAEKRLQELESQITAYPPFNMLQLSHPEDLVMLDAEETPVIYKLTVDKNVQTPAELEGFLKKYEVLTKYFLLELEDETQEEKWLSPILKLAPHYPILLGFGVNADNVLSLISESKIAGIALTGGEELRPGYRNFDELADILELLETDDF